MSSRDKAEERLGPFGSGLNGTPSIGAWNPLAELDPVNGNGITVTTDEAASTSQIGDLGNGKHLDEFRQNEGESSDSVGLNRLDDVLAEVGTNPEIYKPSAAQDADLTPGDNSLLEDVDEDLDSLGQDDALGDELRDVLYTSAGRERKSFLPVSVCDMIITKSRVKRELRKLKKYSANEVISYTDKVWKKSQVSRSDGSNQSTSRLKIFAILVLIDQLAVIGSLVDEDLYDFDLPFYVNKCHREDGKEVRRLHCLERKTGRLTPIRSCEHWSTTVMESFESRQWVVHVPIFYLSTKKEPKIRHYELPTDAIMPFTEDDEKKQEHGGYGDVWRVKIHPSHHNWETEPDEPSFAIKRLRFADKFESEVNNLKRFRRRDHLLLIDLLATYCWRDQYYLIFPWADGNLLKLWETYPEALAPEHNVDATRWFAQQCLKIAEGLQMIHTLDRPQVQDPGDPSYTMSQTHGRHGDLKPENILWFKDRKQDNRPYSVHFKISDFGLTQFHHTVSADQVDAKGVGLSRTYRAPEYDVVNEVSRSYDVWSLACVLLEFVTWYLYGWKEVKGFQSARVLDDKSEILEDVFFNIVRIPRKNGQERMGARAKKSVFEQFEKLFADRHCSEYFIDLLEFIETHMLRMNPTKRADCDSIVKKLRELHDKCNGDSMYCIEKVKTPPRRSGTNLSFFEASVIPYPPGMIERLHRESIPEHHGEVDEDAVITNGNVSDAEPPSLNNNNSNPSSTQDRSSATIANEDPQTPRSPVRPFAGARKSSVSSVYGAERSPSPSKRVRFSGDLESLSENAVIGSTDNIASWPITASPRSHPMGLQTSAALEHEIPIASAPQNAAEYSAIEAERFIDASTVRGKTHGTRTQAAPLRSSRLVGVAEDSTHDFTTRAAPKQGSLDASDPGHNDEHGNDELANIQGQPAQNETVSNVHDNTENSYGHLSDAFLSGFPAKQPHRLQRFIRGMTCGLIKL